MKANSIEEFFGTLLQSVTEAHKKHLMTGKYSAHKALNEFYDEMPELVDALIEHYQGNHGKVESLKNDLLSDDMDTILYLEELKEMCEDAKERFFEEDSAMQSDIDDILGQISSTLYQLRELRENKGIRSLKDIVMESINEGNNPSLEVAPPKETTVAVDYNGDEWVIDDICVYHHRNAQSMRELKKLLKDWDDVNGDMSLTAEIENGDPKFIDGRIVVGCHMKDDPRMTTAMLWGPDGICYEN